MSMTRRRGVRWGDTEDDEAWEVWQREWLAPRVRCKTGCSQEASTVTE